MLRTVQARVIVTLLACSLIFTACIDVDWDLAGGELDQPDTRRSPTAEEQPADDPVGDGQDGRRPDTVTRTPADDERAVDTPTPAARETPAPRTAGLPAVDGHNWQLVDRDDFDGSTLDRGRWEVYDNPATNGVSRWSPDNVGVADGELRIVGRGTNPGGRGNAAGGLCWCGRNGNQTYGMWRVRARLEPAKGYGQAFLLWPASGRWPVDGELDFAEVPHAAKNEVVGVVHWGDPPQGRYDDARLRMDLTQWRTYTVVWRPGLVRYYVDDQLFYDSTGRSRVVVPDDAMHLALQVEPGPFGGSHWVPSPDGSTPDSNVTRVDWVELYR